MTKKNLFKKATMLVLAGAMMMGGVITAHAEGWQKNDIGWWYGTNADNTTWYANGWQWVDGNGDGIAEYYFFEPTGYILADTTTPDGYTVNADGAWTVDGVVQTQALGMQAAAASANGIYDVRDYDSQGLSKAAIDILLHTKEENEKYGVVGSKRFQVQYANGLWAEYDFSKDGRPIWVRSDNDSTRIINETIHVTRQDAEALKAKGYDVSYGASLDIEGFWNDRLTFSISKGTESEYSWLNLRGNGMEDWVNWGTDWGY